MADEKTLTLKLKVSDDGTVSLDRFTGKIERAAQSIGTMNRSLQLIKYDSIINLAQRALNATERIYSFAKSVASAANDIERQSNILGISVEQYQKYIYAAKIADVNTEDFSLSMKMLAKSQQEAIRGGEALKYFEALGMKIDKFKDQKLDEFALDFADAISKYADGGRKIEYMTAVLGRSGDRLVPFFNLGRAGIKAYGEEAVKMGSILGDVVVKKGGEAEAIFKKIESQVNATKISLAPLSLEFAKFFDDLVPKGERFAAIIDEIGRTMRGLKRISEDLGITKGFTPPEIEFTEEKRIASMGTPKWIKEWVDQYAKKPNLPAIPGKANEDAIKLQQKMLEESAKAAGDTAQEILDSMEKMQMDIVNAQKQANAEIDKLMGEDVQSWIAHIEAKEAESFDYYTALADLQRKANQDKENLNAESLAGLFTMIDAKKDEEFDYYKSLADMQKKTNEMKKRAQELMPSLKMEYGELTGNWDAMMKAQKDMLQIEMERIIRENELTGIYKQQVEMLYEQKKAIAEAERTMNVPQLIKIGGNKALLDYNQQLINQYENLLPNGLNIFENAIRNTDGTLRGMLKSASEGFLKLAEDIAFTIAKMEILRVLGLGGGGGGLLGLLGMGGGGGPGINAGQFNPAWGYPMAEGGYVTKPTFALIGERGPEYVIPETKMTRANQSIQATQNLSVGPITISMGDRDKLTARKMKTEIEDAIVKVLREYAR